MHSTVASNMSGLWGNSFLNVHDEPTPHLHLATTAESLINLAQECSKYPIKYVNGGILITFDTSLRAQDFLAILRSEFGREIDHLCQFISPSISLVTLSIDSFSILSNIFSIMDHIEESGRGKCGINIYVGNVHPLFLKFFIDKLDISNSEIIEILQIYGLTTAAVEDCNISTEEYLAIFCKSHHLDSSMCTLLIHEIDFEKIRTGREKRTTCMIRNIPNKYTQKMLVDLIDETHFGQYDFLYLRMDFKNKCNVGYAFINFISPHCIGTFAERMMGRRWPRFNSEKVCQLTFARIQGKAALVEKFRHSRVMMEAEDFRPIIYEMTRTHTKQQQIMINENHNQIFNIHK